LIAETFADLDTPLSLYLKLANRSNTYLLESVEAVNALDVTRSSGLPPRCGCAQSDGS